MAYVVLLLYPEVKSLQIIWESGTRRYLADLQSAVPVVWYNQYFVESIGARRSVTFGWRNSLVNYDSEPDCFNALYPWERMVAYSTWRL